MNEQKEKFYCKLGKIKELIDANEIPDKTYRFDTLRVEVALEFTKAEIEKTI